MLDGNKLVQNDSAIDELDLSRSFYFGEIVRASSVA